MHYSLSMFTSYLPATLMSLIGFRVFASILMNKSLMPRTISELPIDQRRVQHAHYVADFASLIHAIVVFTMSVVAALDNGLDFEKPNSHLESLMPAISYGYFIHDTYSGFKYGYNDLMTHVHHMLGILILPYSMLTQHYGNLICWTYIMGEISNPFMLIKNNLAKHPGYKLIELVSGFIFCVLFISMRVVGGGILGIIIFLSKVPLFVKIIFSVLWFLSLLWSFRVLNLFLKHFAQKNPDGVAGVVYRNLDGLRKDAQKQKVFNAVMAILAFGPPLVAWNHSRLI